MISEESWAIVRIQRQTIHDYHQPRQNTKVLTEDYDPRVGVYKDRLIELLLIIQMIKVDDCTLNSNHVLNISLKLENIYRRE